MWRCGDKYKEGFEEDAKLEMNTENTCKSASRRGRDDVEVRGCPLRGLLTAGLAAATARPSTVERHSTFSIKMTRTPRFGFKPQALT